MPPHCVPPFAEPKAGLQGFVTLESFLADAAAPALGSLLLCTDFQLLGDLTLTPGTQTRGAFATQMIEVINEPDATGEVPGPTRRDEAEETLEALVKAPDDFLERVLQAVRTGRVPPPPPLLKKKTMAMPVHARFQIKVEQERRPPLQGCWMIKEFMSLARTKLQILNEGGEEFDGPDTD